MDFFEVLIVFLLIHGLILIGLIYALVRLYMMGKDLKQLQKDKLAMSQRIQVLEEGLGDQQGLGQAISHEPVHETGQAIRQGVQEVGGPSPIGIQVPQRNPSPRPDIGMNNTKNKSLLADISIESVISKLGIFLLLMGIGYLFSWAYDKDHPLAAMNIGLFIGGLLVFLGYRVEQKKRGLLCQVLYGGSIAVFYAVIFAIYQGFTMIPGGLALILMTVVTVFAWVMSLTRDTASMSIIGVLGGLFTPLLIPVEAFGLFGTGLYLLVITLGGMVIFYVRRWRSLQVTTIVAVEVALVMIINTGFSSKEAIQVTVLLLLLLLVMNGFDYWMHYKKRTCQKAKVFSYLAFGLLPILTAIEIDGLYDIKDLQRVLIYGLVALVFCLITWLFFLKEEKIIPSITVTLASGFMIYAIIAYFSAQVFLLLCFTMGLLMYLVAQKASFRYIRLLGHILYVLTTLGAFGWLIDTMNSGHVTLGETLERFAMVVVVVLAGYMNQGKTRKVLLSGGLVIYMPAILVVTCVVLADYNHWLLISASILAVYIALMYLIQVKWALFFEKLLMVFLFIPVAYKLVSIISHLDTEVDWATVLVFLGYSVYLYWVGHGFAYKRYKIAAYSMVLITVLLEVSDLLDQMAFGIVGVMVIVYLIRWLEPDVETFAMTRYLKVCQLIWFVASLIYLLATNLYEPLNPLLLILDGIFLIFLYLETKEFGIGRWLYLILALNSLAYMWLTYRDLYIAVESSGTFTTLWAIYAIGLLVYGVVKGSKAVMRFALTMIVCVIAKLVLLDMSTLDMIWKVVLSMAFGAVLLLMSYFLHPIMERNTRLDK